MPPRQVKDIVDHIRSYHRALAKRLKESSQHEADPRLRLLLEYMSRHEQNFETALARVEQVAAKGLLNTWLKFVPEETVETALQQLEIRDDMDADEILATVLSFDKKLTDLYRELADTAPTPTIQELFSSLLEMESSKDRQFAMSVLGISDQ